MFRKPGSVTRMPRIKTNRSAAKRFQLHQKWQGQAQEALSPPISTAPRAVAATSRLRRPGTLNKADSERAHAPGSLQVVITVLSGLLVKPLREGFNTAMPRAKGGAKTRRHHKRQLQLASGYVGGRKLYRQARNRPWKKA